MTIPKIYLGAFKCGHRRTYRHYIDDELAYQLLARVEKSNGADTEAHEGLLYMARFNNEYYKAVLPEDESENLHKGPALRKSVRDANNARNRDITNPLPTPNSEAKEVTVRSRQDRRVKDRSVEGTQRMDAENAIIELVALKIEKDSSDEH